MADFFTKVKDGLNKGVATVSTGSKTMIEKTKVDSVINSLEDILQQISYKETQSPNFNSARSGLTFTDLYDQYNYISQVKVPYLFSEILGNKVYDIYMSLGEGDISRDEIMSICNEISTRIEQIKEQKARIEELDAEMNQVMGASVSATTGICSCGHQNAPGAKFCAKCGSKL